VRLDVTGFTLIELILVALLVAVIIGLSSPLFRNTFSDMQLVNTARNLASAIRYAQEMAIVDGSYYKIVCNFKERRYRLVKRIETAEGSSYKPAGGRYGRIFALPEGALLQGKREELLFCPDGKAEGGELKVVSAKGQGYTVTFGGFGEHVVVLPIGQ